MAQAIGGQAVLEGVMMRGPRNWAVAVRKPDGEIAHVCARDRPADGAPLGAAPADRPRRRRARRVARDRLPRAVASRRTTRRRRRTRATSEPAEIGRWALFFSFAVAIGFALMIFKVGPALLDRPAADLERRLVRGRRGPRSASRVFVLYLFLLSLIPSLRRVFQYHAAEHKAINAYEAGEELTPEIAQRYSLIHPRCGTAFLLWVMVIGVFVFALLRAAGLVLADRQPDRVAARDRRDRLRADPLRRQARRQPRR